MELTILLSKVFGIYLLVGGLTYIARQKYFMSVVHDLVSDKGLRMVVATAELTAGLFIIFSHNVWDTMPEMMVSAIGWILAVEGAFYLIVPEKIFRKVVKVFNTSAWYVGGGVISVLAGIYLVNYAFELF